jgi:ClpP class serine protease
VSDLRPLDREVSLSRVVQRLFNKPHAVHPAKVPFILAAIRGKYGIRSIALGGNVIGEVEMGAMAQAGKMEAIARDGRRREGRIFREADGVAIIEVWGTLMKDWGLDPMSGATGYDGIEQKLVAAMEDENIRAIWLDIDSGGGEVAGLFDLVDLIWSFNAKNGGKPIYAMAAEEAYSAAYAIASAGDKLFVPRYGGVGSVGVITLHATFQRQLEAEGIDVTIIRAGEEKARANSFEQLPEHTLAQIQAEAEEIRDGFIETIARNMALSKKTVRETEGLDYMGRHARAIGFVSAVCSEHEAWGKLQRRINR